MSYQPKRTKRSITTTDKTSSAGSKKVFDPELESFTKRTRFESQLHRDNSKNQKLSIDKLVENILFALQKFYGDDDSGFEAKCREFLTKGIESWKLNIVDRLDMYEYVQKACRKKPFSDIEAEIIKEWRKNYLLFAIMTYWYNAILKTKFQSLKQFYKKYEVCCEFVAQISAMIFRSWLVEWEKRVKGTEGCAVNKIYEQTSHFIITESSEFKKVYEKLLLPLIECETFHTKVDWKYNLEDLNAKKGVFDLDREENLPKTIEVLKKFSKQIKLIKKIQLIRQYRSTLQAELAYQFEELKKKGEGKNCQILQKDDYITALIYCIVKGHLTELQPALVYMQTLLGQNLRVLAKMQLNSFAVDLIAALDFLCEKHRQKTAPQEELLDTLEIKPLYNKFVSSPQIPPEIQDLSYSLKKNLTEKRITEFELPS